MWKKWLWFSGLLLSLSVVGMTLVEAKPIDQPNVPASAEGVDSFNDQVILDLATPNYTISSADLPIGKFDRLTVPDQAYTDRAGYPQLPLKSFLVGAPPDARVELVVLADEVVLLSGTYRLSPAPKPAPLTADFQAGQMRDVINSSAYSANTLYPNQPASITEDAWMRDQRIIRVELYPFQVRTDRGELIWHRHLQVAVRFDRTTSLARAQSTNSLPSPFESALRSTLVNYEQAKRWRAQPADQPISAQAQPALNQFSASAPSSSTSPQIKIVVDHDGIYRVTYDDLISAGLVITGLNPDNFHLTSQEQDVAIYVSNQTAGIFAPGDFIEFYGQKFRGDVLAARYANESSQWMTYPNGWHAQFNATMLEKYTDDNVYWLSVDGSAGPRMAAIDGTPDGVSPTPDYYTTTMHAEQSNFWWSYSFTSEDTWFWDNVQTYPNVITTKTYTTSLSAIANVPQAAIVRGEIVARAENATDSPDHRTQFWLNSEVAPFTDNTWDGLIRYHFEGYVPQADLISGVNQLRMVVLPQPAVPKDEIYFDWFEVQYAHLFQAGNDQILFSDASIGPRQYVITNFVTSTLKIYDVTNPLLPQRVLSATISGDGSNVSTTIGVSSTSPLTYYVIGADMIRTPKSVTTYTAPDLLSASNGADYIIIAPTAFLTASQTLANYRASQGMRVKIIDVADLYNMFNVGIYNPIAIKNFLAYAYSHWQPPAPAYAVLIGDGHWNFKNNGSYGDPTIYMPPFLAFVDPWQGEVDSTNLLAAFVGSDTLPDMSIGRVPVNSIDELNTVISKTISYEQAGPQSYQTRSLFAADNWDQGGNFGQFSDVLIASSYPTYLQVDRVYIDNLPPKALCAIQIYNGCRYWTGVITNTLNQSGTLFLVYGGHGYIHYWAAENLLADTDIPQLTNLNHLSIVLDMTCLDGYWFGPPYPSNHFGQSFMEQIIRATNGGAVATFSAGGLGLATGHNALMGGLLNAIFKGGVQRLGPASIAGKLNVYLSGGDGLDLINTYTVLGDPALRLPTYSISAWSRAFAKSGNPGTVVKYTLPVTNLAYLQDQITITLSGNAWPTDVAAPIALPQTTTNVVVSVTIPSLTLPGVTDVVSVTIASLGREVPNDYAVLTTTANAFYQFNLSTPLAAQSQLRNTVVSYTLQLTNSGNLADVFSLSNSGDVWPSSLSTYSLAMQPFESTDIIISTTIPPSATLTEMEVVTVTVNSKGSGLSQLQAFKTTVLAPYSILLPLVLRNK